MRPRSQQRSVFQCGECSYASPSSDDFEIHFKCHAEEKPHTCDLCHVALASLSELEKHKLSQHSQNPTAYACDQCGRHFRYQKGLARHKKLSHENFRPYTCRHCSYRTGTKQHLAAHELTHSGCKRFACAHCDYQSYRKELLVRHMTNHTGVKPLHCYHCGYGANEKGALRRHMITHVGGKKFSCDYCNFSCTRKTSLSRHKTRKHSGSKAFKCKWCNRNFHFLGDLRMHEKLHGYKPFICNICHSSFTHNYLLKKHFKDAHTIKEEERQEEEEEESVEFFF